MNNKIIVTSGYMGSGSSAITDLLCEVNGFESRHGSYEYIFMHCPDGVFDLEYKLLYENNAMRSDEALHSFYNCMYQLYSERKWWFADYKHKIDKNFMKYCEAYIDSLIDKRLPENFWHHQERVVENNKIKRIINRILGKHRKNVPDLIYNGMWIAYPTREEFYNKTRIFLKEVFNSMGIKNNNIIMDQLLLPHNVHKVDNYFDDNCKVIIVDRDPRDVFILNKYFWKPLNTPVPYPFNVEDFCTHYYKMRKSEKIIPSKKVLRIHFEDLIYHYYDTKKIIFDFIGINDCDHIKQFSRLIPEKSMLNTQLYNRNCIYIEEAKYIEKHLNEYIYNFPIIKHEEILNKDVIL